jgi:hypothetical protein
MVRQACLGRQAGRQARRVDSEPPAELTSPRHYASFLLVKSGRREGGRGENVVQKKRIKSFIVIQYK